VPGSPAECLAGALLPATVPRGCLEGTMMSSVLLLRPFTFEVLAPRPTSTVCLGPRPAPLLSGVVLLLLLLLSS
jgi:hypothetical protein